MKLKALFVCSGNTGQADVIIKNQADSLIAEGIDVDFFLIRGKGLKGYYKNITPLKKLLKSNKYDIIHAHYVYSGWVAFFASSKIPLIVSYMGCDTYGNYNKNGKLIPNSIIDILLGKLFQPFPKAIIVKSENLKRYIHFKRKTHLIPNGVNFNALKLDKIETAKLKLELSQNKKYVLFLGNTSDTRKNFNLLVESQKFCETHFEIISPFPFKNNNVQLYLNAADVLILSSYNEGSPNVVKEAMACNCPIVSTDVGDVRRVIEGTEGCFISSFEPEDVAKKIDMAIQFGRRTKGRERIIDLGLNSEVVAKQIINLYKSVLNY